MKLAHLRSRIKEAATLKASAQRLMRDMTEMLSDKSLPDGLRTQIEGVRKELKRTWAELAHDAEGPVSTKTAEAASKNDPLAVEAPENTIAPLSSESATTTGSPNVECYDDMPVAAQYAIPTSTWGAKTFADLDAAEAADEATEEIYERTGQLQRLVSNVMSDPLETDKVNALKTIFDEYTMLVAGLTGGGATIAGAEAATAPDPRGERLVESVGGALSLLAETDGSAVGSGARSPFKMDVRLITPGWGNARDNHYYSPDVLRRDAKVFEGVKMYTTDHRENEKSVRTEVARIDSIERFADDGAPIARVTVFDPDFAEQTRNRNQAGILDSLECSILAYGKAKPGVVEGRKGNIVESITAAQSVDFVTKAGAGGGAINIAESAAPTPVRHAHGSDPTQGVTSMPPETTQPTTTSASITAQPPVTTAPATPPVAAPAPLAEADVRTALAATTLPAPSQKRLTEQAYPDRAALDTAVVAEIAYLKEVTGSGKPVMPASASGDKPATLAETNKRVDQTLDHFFGPSRAPAQAAQKGQ